MSTTQLPVLKSKIGKRGKLIVPPDDHVLHYKIIDEVRRPQTRMPEKILCLQLIKFEDERIEVRSGYYIIGKKPRMLGKWVWGQYAAMMPLNDFKSLIEEAESKGWFTSRHEVLGE